MQVTSAAGRWLIIGEFVILLLLLLFLLLLHDQWSLSEEHRPTPRALARTSVQLCECLIFSTFGNEKITTQLASTQDGGGGGGEDEEERAEVVCCCLDSSGTLCRKSTVRGNQKLTVAALLLLLSGLIPSDS